MLEVRLPAASCDISIAKQQQQHQQQGQQQQQQQHQHQHQQRQQQQVSKSGDGLSARAAGVVVKLVQKLCTQDRHADEGRLPAQKRLRIWKQRKGDVQPRKISAAQLNLCLSYDTFTPMYVCSAKLKPRQPLDCEVSILCQ